MEKRLMDKLPDIHKIALLRATALGDFIASTPALYALREAYLEAEIVYLGKPWHKEFLEERPGPVDRVIVVPPKPGVREEADMPEDLQEFEAFCVQMRAEKFDLAIQFNGGGANTNPVIKRFGARHSVGMKTPNAPELDRWMPYIFYHSEFMRLLELVSLVGADMCDPTPRVEVTAKDLAEVERHLPGLRSFAVLHPGAGDVRRRWPPERFAQVGDALAQRGLDVIVTGVPSEREVVERVIAGMTCPAINACNLLTLGGLAGLMSRAAIVVSNDSGPLHLADAVGAPTVGLFWCGNYFNWSHVGRRNHRPLASWMTHCPHCGGDMTKDTNPNEACDHMTCFVDLITVDEVVNTTFELMDYQQRAAEFA
jgi:ADP-heptose:LPS heptosyltransferase